MMSQIDWCMRQLVHTNKAINSLVAVGPPSKTKILMCSHMEAKFIAFCQLLKSAGFEVHAISNLPTSLKREFLHEVQSSGITFYDNSRMDFETSEKFIQDIVNREHFDFVFDDGAHAYSKMFNVNDGVKTICTEYTQSGVTKAQSLNLTVPVINLNSSLTKKLIGNIYGTGISALTAIQSITNISFHHLNVGIIGFGPVGLSCALSFLGAGANVFAYDINADRKSIAEKYNVQWRGRPELLSKCDLVITCTGHPDAISGQDIQFLKNDCILANVGHHNYEIRIPEEVQKTSITPHIEEFIFNERKFYSLCGGNLVNLAFGLGYPIQIIDVSFAAAVYAWKHFSKVSDLQPKLYDHPEELDFKNFKQEIENYDLAVY